MDHNEKIYRIAFFARKNKLFLCDLLLEYLKQTNNKINGKKVEVEVLDIDRPIEGCFDIIFHKLDCLSDKDASYQYLCLYLQNNLSVCCLDPIEKVIQVSDRRHMGDLFNRMNLEFDGHLINGAESHLLTIDKGIDKEFSYPQIVKGLDGADHDHKFCFTKAGLEMALQQFQTCIAQTYLYHNAIIYKVYVIGDYTWVFKRPSFSDKEIRDMTQKLQIADVPRISVPSENFDQVLNDTDPDIKFFSKVSHYIGQISGLQIFGYDLITETNINKHYIVDINYAPSFRGIDSEELSASLYILFGHYIK